MNINEVANKVTTIIEQLVAEKKMSYMDAILYYCGQSSTDPEDLAPFIIGRLKEEITKEAINLHLIDGKQIEIELDVITE